MTSPVLGHPLASFLDSRFREELVIWLASVQNECFDHEVVPPSVFKVPETLGRTADDPAETDNNPVLDAAPGNPGAGILFLRSEAFGPRQAHKAVELTVMHGDGAMRVLSWREVR